MARKLGGGGGGSINRTAGLLKLGGGGLLLSISGSIQIAGPWGSAIPEGGAVTQCQLWAFSI